MNIYFGGSCRRRFGRHLILAAGSMLGLVAGARADSGSAGWLQQTDSKSGITIFVNPQISTPTSTYRDPFWTPQRLAELKPESMPVVKPETTGPGVSPFAVVPAGAAGQQYTQTRVFPDGEISLGFGVGPNDNPYARAGKLVYMTTRGPSWCTASVIDRRLVITAGHCVFEPGTHILRTHFRFYPAAYPNAAGGPTNPNSTFGSWDVAAVAITPEWQNSTGTTPNAADFAILLTQDSLRGRIGDVVGHYTLGPVAGPGRVSNVVVIGYPINLDGGQRMQQTFGQTRDRPGAAPAISQEIGTNMEGGASGGPWLVDFGITAAGQTSRANPNTVIGVDSYRRDNNVAIGGVPQAGTNGASFITPSLIAIRNRLCAPPLPADNCYPGH